MAVARARRAAVLDSVCGTGRTHSIAALGDVALAGRGAAFGPRVARRGRARAGTIAYIRGTPVAVTRARRAAGLETVGGTARVDSIAALGDVALAGRGAALGPRVAGRMGACAASVADVRSAEIGVARARGATRLEGVGRTRGA